MGEPPQLDRPRSSRWHTKWCLEPDVVVSEAVPHYQACNRTPNIPEMIINQRKEPDLTLPPPDKPYGALTLSWLPTVSYVSLSTMTPAQETEPLVREQTGISG